TCSAAAIRDPSRAVDGVFPDDLFTVSDGATATGRRVAVADAPWIADVPVAWQPMFKELDTLDGFGTAAPVFLRFTAPIALPGPEAVRLIALTDPPEDVALDVSLLDDGQTLALDPRTPLVGATRHLVVATRALQAADGGCVDAAGGPLPEELAAADVAADEVVVAATFTTQSVLQSSQAIAEAIVRRTPTWDGPARCEQQQGRRHCERQFLAADFRGDDGIIDAPRPRGSYLLPVSIWIPDGAGPWPVIIAGHGLSDSRAFGGFIDQLAGEPVAVVAIDSPFHGEHPGGVSGNPLFLLRDFFAVDLAARTLAPRRMRDVFRTATFDKLQLLNLLRQAPDLDGDGLSDVDPSRLGYFGLSLGGILGGEFLALAPGVEAAVLSVPGARITRIMRDSDTFGALINSFLPAGASDGAIKRIFGAIQTLADAGDPVNFAPHILRDRLPRAGEAPDLLVLMAVGDEVVPNTGTESLARALGLPVLAPVSVPWDGVPVVEAGPLHANLEGGVTAGLFQHARVSGGRPPSVRTADADHNNVTGSHEGIRQISHFLDAWLAGEAVEIIAP
ncbi:MAG: hypothetical protein KC549_14780, partial [Myxococcales bacterium]|nr:hypothetical protein [Myxococcales bacterium]